MHLGLTQPARGLVLCAALGLVVGCAELEDGDMPADALAETDDSTGDTTDTGDTDTGTGEDTTPPCGDPADELYAAQCAVCHGADLQGWTANPDALGPGLAGEGLRDWWFELTRDGMEGRYGEVPMPPFTEADWTDEELDEILAFVLDGETAGKLAWTTACGSCHGTRPAKGGTGPALAGDGLVAQWVEAIALRPTPEGVKPMTPFPNLCEDDLLALSEWLVAGGGDP